MVFPAEEIPIYKGVSQGVAGIKLRDHDKVLAFDISRTSLEGPEVITAQGRNLVVRERKFGISSRGGKGRIVLKRGSIDIWVRGPVQMLGDDEGEE